MNKRHLRPKRLLVIPAFIGLLVITYILGLLPVPFIDYPQLPIMFVGLVRILALTLALVILLVIIGLGWFLVSEAYEWIFPKEVD